MARKNIGLDAELNPEQYDDEAAPPVAVAPTVVPAPAPAAPAVDMTALIQGLTQALSQGVAGAIESAKPARMSREDHEYERVSHYNPVGDAVRPRQDLYPPHKVYWGVLNEEDPSKPPANLYEIEPDSLTYDELQALRAITPGKYSIELNDGKQEPLVSYAKTDVADGSTLAVTLALRKHCYGKDRRNMVPNLRALARQVTATAVA